MTVSSGQLIRMCKIMHAYLFLVCFISQSPRFSNTTLIAIANFVGLGFYCFIISKVAIELYDA